MQSKKRIDDDAFAFVKSTTTKGTQTEKTASAKKSSSAVNKDAKTAPKEIAASSEDASIVATVKSSNRSVFVLYNNEGTILSVAEVNKKYHPERSIPFITSKGTFATELFVPNDLAASDIAVIHDQCIVAGLDTKPNPSPYLLIN